MGILSDLAKNGTDKELEFKMGSLLGNLYRSSPQSYDITEALINRISALEERMARYETSKTD